jgi:hypothetical protein
MAAAEQTAMAEQDLQVDVVVTEVAVPADRMAVVSLEEVVPVLEAEPLAAAEAVVPAEVLV